MAGPSNESRRSFRWGDSVARAFLGLVACALIGAGVASVWLDHLLLAAPLVILGLAAAVMCAYFGTVSGEVNCRVIRFRFGVERPAAAFDRRGEQR